jgi:hypothetical protein
MVNATQQDAPKSPRGWVWLARCALAFLFIFSLLMVSAILLLFLESNSGRWHEWRTIFWFIVCVAALSCGIIPYILVVWNQRRESTREKGIFEALITGVFWFFVGWIILSDSVFHGVSAFNPRGMAGDFTDFLEASLGVFLILTLPAFLLQLSGMKLLNFHGKLTATAAAPRPCKPPLAVRAGVGTTMALLLCPAALGLFTFKRSLPSLQLGVIEALLLGAALPYALVWRDLQQGELRCQAQKSASALATGFLTLLATSGVTYGFISWGTPLSWPHRMSTWAEFVFFALLGVLNIAVLLAGRSYARQAEVGGGKMQFTWGAMGVSSCLMVFGLFVMWVSASV